MDESLKLDGNAAAGDLGEVFSFEVTAAQYACGGCGKNGALGAAMVYEARDLGIVVRCPGCDNPLIRLSQGHGPHVLDLRGVDYLTVG